MKKRIFLFVAALVMAALPYCAAFGGSSPIEDILLSEDWVNVGGTGVPLHFEIGGTGKLITGDGGDIGVFWASAGKQITIIHDYPGAISYSYILQQQNGLYVLASSSGGRLIRTSDYIRLNDESSSFMNTHAVQFGEKVELGFADLSFDSTLITNRLQGSSGKGYLVISQADKSYYVILASLTNCSDNTIHITNINGRILIDGEHVFPIRTEAEIDGMLTKELPAHCSGTLFLLAEIPNHIVRNISTATMYIAFDDRFAQIPLTVRDGVFIVEVAVHE